MVFVSNRFPKFLLRDDDSVRSGHRQGNHIYLSHTHTCTLTHTHPSEAQSLGHSELELLWIRHANASHWFTVSAPSVTVCGRAHVPPILQVGKLSVRVMKKPDTTKFRNSVHLTTAPYCPLTVLLLLI